MTDTGHAAYFVPTGTEQINLAQFYRALSAEEKRSESTQPRRDSTFATSGPASPGGAGTPTERDTAETVTVHHLQPTRHTESPWGPGFQHGSPPAALIAVLLEAGAKEAGLDEHGRFSRMTVEILGAVPLTALRGYARILRPGKRINFFEAVVVDDQGRECVRGSGWWIRSQDTSELERTIGEAIPGRGGAEPDTAFLERWKSGYIDSIEIQRVPLEAEQLRGNEQRNPYAYWSKSDLPVIAGTEDSPWVRLMKTVDIANGLNAVLDVDQWSYMNLDTTVYLHHDMRGEWLGLVAEANYGTDGMGTTVTRIYDEQGPIGTCNQGFILAPRA